MPDTKKNIKFNFPRSTLEEMLRIMRECRENGNVECEKVLKAFIGKGLRDVDYNKLKNKLFGEETNKSNVFKKK